MMMRIMLMIMIMITIIIIINNNNNNNNDNNNNNELQEMDMQKDTEELLIIYRSFHSQADVRIGFTWLKTRVKASAAKKEWDGQRSRREGAEEKWGLKSIKVTDAVRAERKLLVKSPAWSIFKGHSGCWRAWRWASKGQVKKETEGFITAAQSQALRKNSKKSFIDKQDIPPKFRLCGREGTVNIDLKIH